MTRRGLPALWFALLVAFAPPAARAQEYPVHSGELVVDTGDGTSYGSTQGEPLAPGEELRLRGGGFEPGSDVTVTIESKPIVVTHTKADAAGFIDTTITIPEGVPAGDHTLKATGPAPGGGVVVLSQPLEVADTPATAGDAAPSDRAAEEPANHSRPYVPIALALTAALMLAGALALRRVFA